MLGTFIGVLPGAVEGVAACEAANNAAAGAFAPLLALGIPGSGTGAVLLGGLMLWGLNPGPLLFQTNPEFAWGLIASLFIANLITLAVAVAIIPFLINILSVPAGLMIPAITVVCVVGSFSTTNSLFGVIVMLACGLIGYLFKEGDYPVQPLVLAVVLAKLLEVNFRRAFLTSGGSISIFFTRPISLVFMIILITFIATPIVKWIIRKLKTN